MGLTAAAVAGCCGAVRHLLAWSANRDFGRVRPPCNLNQGRQRSLPESRPSRIRCATAFFFCRIGFQPVRVLPIDGQAGSLSYETAVGELRPAAYNSEQG